MTLNDNDIRKNALELRQSGMFVSDIAKKLEMSVAIVSHHLQVMSREDLLVPVRDGKNVCYGLSKGPFISDLKKFICKHK